MVEIDPSENPRWTFSYMTVVLMKADLPLVQSLFLPVSHKIAQGRTRIVDTNTKQSTFFELLYLYYTFPEGAVMRL